MVDSFEEISFLTRSENRVEVLETLSTGEYEKSEIVESTGISEVTVERALEDFEDRGWIYEYDGAYALTVVGELIAEDYARLSESMRLARRLGPVLEYLPIGEMTFDVRLLTDARISDPETFDPLQAMDSRVEVVREAGRVVGIAPATYAKELVVKPFHAAVTENDLTLRVVVTPEYVETVRERSALRRLVRETLRADAELYVTPDGTEVDAAIALYDDLATITGFDRTGTPRVSIESGHGALREWVWDIYERYRADSSPLSPDDFPG